MTVSLIGDGIFLVAIAWETYTLWNAPAALSIVGIGMTVPTIAFLLVGGVVSDRYDRRLVMAWADGLRAVAVGALAVLIFTGTLQFWQLVAVVAFYGIGTAFFMPAFEAIVPDLIPKPELPAANALDQFVRPIALRLVGPVAGGALVALSAGLAFTVDAASFAASLAAVLAIPKRTQLDSDASDVPDGGSQRRPAVRPRPRLAVGNASLRSVRISPLSRSGRSATSLPREERAARLRRHAWPRGCGRWARGRRCGGLHGPARPPETRRDRHVRDLDPRDVGDRRLRHCERRLAADDRLPPVQRSRGSGHDRVGDDQAAPCPRLDAGAGLEPRLVGLDRTHAAVICAHRPRCGCWSACERP